MNETKTKLKTRTIVIITIIAIILGFFSCIDFFHPNLGGDIQGKYVVDGKITDQEGLQTVFVSTTSNMDDPNFCGVAFCKVQIFDSKGNTFNFNESTNERGKYTTWIGKEFLKPGTSYQLKVTTSGGIEIISDFDKMPECPDVDSIYYERKDQPTTNTYKTLQGLQFYIDLKRQPTSGLYYKWEIEETWEHHAVYPITWFVHPDSGLIKRFPPDYSRFTCYTTDRLHDFFTLATDSSQINYNRQSLHYVDNQTQRLTYCYSILVSQYAISEPAFNFWTNLMKNSSTQGGLYSSQPIRIKGNFKSTTNPSIEILGYFGAYSVKTKRIFIVSTKEIDRCLPSCIPPGVDKSAKKYFIEVYEDNSNKFKLLNVTNGCCECDYLSGTTAKPSFWPY